MNSPRITHIALGSNVGNRLQFLQNAVDKLFAEVGDIMEVSKVYETPAWGFDGNAFLNACISISTRFSAEQVLQKLLKIETESGRLRTASKNYQNRSLDLDILLFEDEMIKTEKLVVPHPEMHNRKFVLLPLTDIASAEQHPVLKLSINELLEKTTDTSQIKAIQSSLKIPKRNYSLQSCNYIAIEGNIGAGKTSLATMVSQDFNAKLILERFKDNPFLPKFYQNRERYAFPLEMSLLADRYQQLSDDLAQYDLFRDFVVSDYDIFKSSIFAKITLQEDEYLLYNKLFELIYKEMKKPDLYVYLYQDTDKLLEKIRIRGREYEQKIQASYLEDIHKSYLRFIRSQSRMKVQVIDITKKDFINNRPDYLSLLDEIEG